MVFLPPRHSKSESVSRLFSAYYLHRYPERWVGLASYGADLAYTLSRAARDNFRAGGGTLRDDAEAVKHWETPQGGGLWAAGVGGPITGKGWHLGIIDDPLKNAEEAASETIRLKQQEWYRAAFYTREEPDGHGNADGALVVIQTRWHESDLAGWLLDRETDDDEDPEGWHIVNLPAIAEDGEHTFPATCTVEPDWRQPGEALCPERRPLEKLRRIERAVGAYYWDALYQQRPSAREGLFFKVGMLEVVGAVPVGSRRVRYWDLAGAAPGKGDWTCGCLLAAAPDGRFYVEHVRRGQWPAAERTGIIRQQAQLDRARYGDVPVFIEQAPGLAKEPTEDLVRALAGFTVAADLAHRDKVSRAEPFAAQVNAGNVSLLADVEGDRWHSAFLNELRVFPNGKFDDQCDAAAGAFSRLAKVRTYGVS